MWRQAGASETKNKSSNKKTRRKISNSWKANSSWRVKYIYYRSLWFLPDARCDWEILLKHLNHGEVKCPEPEGEVTPHQC